jgi:tetratricopeptide (TPR) repeat protein
MTSMESRAQACETIFGKLLSLTDNLHQTEESKTNYWETQVCNDDQECIRFCKYVSMKWIIKTLSDHKSKNEEITRVLELREDCRTDCDAQIYAYFLYFCGILFLLQGRKKEDNEHRDQLREFFKSQGQHRTDSNVRLLFRFLSAYIDLVDPNEQDISVFKEVKCCLTNDDDNIIFDAIEEEHKLMEEILFDPIEEKPKWMQEILQQIRQRTQDHSNAIKRIFPPIDGKYKKYNGKGRREYINGKDVIQSLIHSGIARLFFIAGREHAHIAELTKALKAFPDNSFALIQAAHLVVEYRKALEALDKENNKKPLDQKDNCLKELFTIIQTAHPAKVINKNYVDTSENLYEKVIKLIDDNEQFSDSDYRPFNYRIKFEALLGLAYVYSIKGLDSKAKRNYEEAGEIIEEHFRDNKVKEHKTDEYYYLRTIFLINRGRNTFVNGPIRSRGAAKKDFEDVLDLYKDSPARIKDELAEIAARAHNNLGICYLNEADYRKAEEHFRKAIKIDDTNAHARYNLGVLHYRKNEQERALTLFQNAHNLDPKLSEAGEALEKLDAVERGRPGSQWFNWWFPEKNKR